MARVLYISYTGLLDPLGQSQVLQYVLQLAKQHTMHLLSFEKPAALRDKTRLQTLQAACTAAGVSWTHLTYHNKPNLLASAYDVALGSFEAIQVVRKEQIQLVHCRSYLAGVMGRMCTQATGCRHIFDMRGFWPDERVDGGIWPKASARYRFFKAVERWLLTSTDHLVSLTRSGVREIEKFEYLHGKPMAVTVIPTCTNLSMFRPLISAAAQAPFTLGYVGSAGSWYMFDEVARSVRLLMKQIPAARFRVINKGGHDAIRETLQRNGVDLTRVDILAAPFDRVAAEIAQMDAGIFFIKPAWSKRASCPTRMGEFLACGKPCLSNTGVGDVEDDLAQTRTGITVSDWSDATLEHALKGLVALAREPDIAQRCHAAAEQRFSLEVGVARYAEIYDRLSSSSAEQSIERPV